MAPILLLSNPGVATKLPPSKLHESTIFYLNNVVKCIEMVISLPADTQVPIYFVSDHLESMESPLMDGLLALLLLLESERKEFQFNWIILAEAGGEAGEEEGDYNAHDNVHDARDDDRRMWKEAFPFINFSSSLLNSIQLPQIGPIQVDSDWLFNQFQVSNTLKIIKKDQVKAFLSSKYFNLTTSPAVKIQISDGILFEFQFSHKNALMFLDPHEKSLSFVEPIYVPYMKKFFKTRTTPVTLDQQQPSAKWLENSFSLSDWTCIDQDSLKKDNKLKLKKLILLSLRGMGIKKSDKNFLDIWKHLYCGCIFSLVKEKKIAIVSILSFTLEKGIEYYRIRSKCPIENYQGKY